MNLNYSENLSVEDFKCLPVICRVVGGNNPGAVSVLRQLFVMKKLNFIYTGKDVIEAFDHLKIYGGKIWSLVHKVCGNDFKYLENVLLAVAWEVVSETELHSRIDQGIPFVNLPSIEQMMLDFEK